MAWRNERFLHKRNCDKCGKSMISVFAPDCGLIVYCSPCWWSDEWDATQYGIDFDPNKPFLIQLQELLHRVPVMNLYGLYTTLTNSDYTNMVSYLKNCYMVTYSDFCENVIYGSFVNHTKDSVDNLMSEQNELCYDTVNCAKCYRTFYSQDSEECRNIYFSKDCVGCSDCFGCVNLRNKKYHIWNQPVSKEEFEAFIIENTASAEKIAEQKIKAHDFWNNFPNKYIHGIHNNNVSGDYIFNSKNTLHSYSVGDAEDCKFCQFVTAGGLKDSYDFVNFGITSSLLYEVMQAGDQTSRICFSWFTITNAYDIDYGMFIIGGKNIFGSVSIKKKQYCILNKEYSKEEFEKLRKIIIDQMNTMPYIDKGGKKYPYGEFFPAELSPFGYNETTAQEFSPLSKEEAARQNFIWREPVSRNYAITMTADKLPKIDAVDDSILKETIGCAHEGRCDHQCSTAFRIVPQELQFYRQLNLGLPQLCPNCRHGERLTQRNSIELQKRRCDCRGAKSGNGKYANTGEHFHRTGTCPNEFETSYSPDRPEIVYCEQCYQAEVV